MKSLKLISALIIAGGALASQIAAAAPTSGTITFNGALVADTCVVDAGAGNSFAVTLPSVQTTAFTGVGNAQGTTPFTIALTGCSVGVPVRAFFSGANINGTTGNLTNLGVATGVEVQMLNSTNAVINLAGADATAQGDTLLTTDATGAATLGYSAQYLSTAAAPTAGSVTSNVNYEIVYQ
ncbi:MULTISPECIES: fimbrial protein [Silvimonas]|uniref:fimbrial protein n=1 Tax=Silvimonas TaxID=300264 RepID=UPI0024B33A03|nr:MULTISPECIES: fimbrial protein [Silvimonas]MDR3427335.1 fimbrial protein [Silvimonas sp.]